MYNVIKKRSRALAAAKSAKTDEVDSDGETAADNAMAKPSSFGPSQADFESHLVTRTTSERPGASAKGSYIGTPYDTVQTKAGDRLDRLKAAGGAGAADETGPFQNKTTRNEITGGSLLGNVLPHAAEGESSPSHSAPPAADNPAEMADHHQKLADYFNKIAHPGSQSIPATTQTNDYEKSELKDDTDMKPEY